MHVWVGVLQILYMGPKKTEIYANNATLVNVSMYILIISLYDFMTKTWMILVRMRIKSSLITSITKAMTKVMTKAMTRVLADQ